MGLATLSRETAVLFPAGYACYFLWHRQWKEVVYFTTLGILPLFAWLVILYLIFGKTGLTFAPPFEHTPFAGFLYYAHTPKKFWLLLLLVILPTLGGWLLVGIGLIRRHIGQAFLILLANLLLVTFMSRNSANDLISSGRIATGLVLAGQLYSIMTQNKYTLRLAPTHELTMAVLEQAAATLQAHLK